MADGRRTRDAAGGDRWRWPVVVACLLLAWAVVASAAAGLAAAGGPAFPARVLAPGSDAALLEAAGAGAVRRGGAPASAGRALLNRAAIRAPLSFEPFLARALARAAAGEGRAAVLAGEAARAREPRAVAVRAVLLRAYLRAGRFPEAIGEIGALIALAGTADGRALRLLALMADAPGTAAFVEAALRTRPPWGGAFLDHAIAHGVNRSLLFRALRRPEPGEERARFLRALVAAGDYERAYLAWVGFLPPSRVATVAPVYDGAFREPGAPAPFNWTLRTDGLATAERTRDTVLPGGTALDVRYFGTAEAVVARETLLLPPGHYAFSVLARGSADGPLAGSLRWSIACLPSSAVLPLGGALGPPSRTTRFRAAVTLPAEGCAAQELVLGGEPGEVAGTIAAQFTAVSLEKR